MSQPLDLNNVQGDIFDGLPKKVEAFFFFQITDPSKFRHDLTSVIPHITTYVQAQEAHKAIRDGKGSGKIIPMAAVNISFSHKGLVRLGLAADLGDIAFANGQLANAEGVLGDDLKEWDEDFKKDLHGLILVTGDCNENVDMKLGSTKALFGCGTPHASIVEVTHIVGHVRPGKEDGHEHFGFNDGLSQPAVTGVTPKPLLPGVEEVPQGIVLMGREGDIATVNPVGTSVPVVRPAWALDGTLLAFRYLKQLVPEFDKFLEDNALPIAPPQPGSGDPTGAELLGARLVGRWKSGAPIDLTPFRDDPALAVPEKNQAFRFDPTSQLRCPFAAHLRKTNPRDDLKAFGGTTIRRIIRRGIQFGPEVTPEERKANKSSDRNDLERGLLFACYQSNLRNGFEFIQQRRSFVNASDIFVQALTSIEWANTNNFPPAKNTATPPAPVPGLDPIIGRANNGPNGIPPNLLELVGTNPGTGPDFSAQALELKTDEFVVPRGGEYFFVPALGVLRTVIAAHEPAELK